MEWRCYELLHGGEGPRGDHVDVVCSDNRAEAAEEAAQHFDDCEQRAAGDGNDEFDGSWQYIEVVGQDGRSTKHEVVCEVKRVYTDVIR
jgi:hypothetical protein